MKKKKMMMVLLIAIALVLLAGNLHHLRSALPEKWTVQKGTVNKKSVGLDIQVGLVPGILIQVTNNQ